MHVSEILRQRMERHLRVSRTQSCYQSLHADSPDAMQLDISAASLHQPCQVLGCDSCVGISRQIFQGSRVELNCLCSPPIAGEDKDKDYFADNILSHLLANSAFIRLCAFYFFYYLPLALNLPLHNPPASSSGSHSLQPHRHTHRPSSASSAQAPVQYTRPNPTTPH
jgi:hypothetical protein